MTKCGISICILARVSDKDEHSIKIKEWATEFMVAETIKPMPLTSMITVATEFLGRDTRRLFNIAVDEGWLLRSPFTKAVSRNLIHDAAETPDPIKTRELTDEEARE
jgi:hypothetical protein